LALRRNAQDFHSGSRVAGPACGVKRRGAALCTCGPANGLFQAQRVPLYS